MRHTTQCVKIPAFGFADTKPHYELLDGLRASLPCLSCSTTSLRAMPLQALSMALATASSPTSIMAILRWISSSCSQVLSLAMPTTTVGSEALR